MRAVWRLSTILLLAVQPALTAQSFRPAVLVDTTHGVIEPISSPRPLGRPHGVRWWEAASVAGTTLVLMSSDQKISHEFQEHPTHAAATVASVFRRVGQPEIYAVVPLGVLTAGLLTNDEDVTRAGGRLVASVALSTAAFQTLKLVSGRARPDAGQGAFAFSPFSGRGAFPSGHSTVAFALATSLAEELHNGWATAALYAIATGTAWSRVYDERHWASDVVLGAAVGITTAKVVHGRWRLFGLCSPTFLVEPEGAGMRVRIPLH
jgi:membrane-associated phospholipid phosphatase